MLTPPLNRLEGLAPVYRQLLAASAAGGRCRSPTGALPSGEIVTRLSPYRLLFSRQSWYVIGRSSLHRATRTFNVAGSAARRAGRIVSHAARLLPRTLPRQRLALIPEPGRDHEVLRPFQSDRCRQRGRGLLAQDAAAAMERRRHARLSRHGFRAERDLLVDPGLRRPGRGRSSRRELRQLIVGRVEGTLARYRPLV